MNATFKLFTATLFSILICRFGNANEEFIIDRLPSITFKIHRDLSNQNIVQNESNGLFYVSGNLKDSISETLIYIFNEEGDSISESQFEFESKGIWINSGLDFLEAYDVKNNSCVSFFLDVDGNFESHEVLHRIDSLQGLNERTFTVYNSISDVYAYIEPVAGMIIEISPYSGEIEHFVSLNLNLQKDFLAEILLYTNHPEYPYALINKKENRLSFINGEGDISQNIALPLQIGHVGGWGFTANHLWSYNRDTLSWEAYEICMSSL